MRPRVPRPDQAQNALSQSPSPAPPPDQSGLHRSLDSLNGDQAARQSKLVNGLHQAALRLQAINATAERMQEQAGSGVETLDRSIAAVGRRLFRLQTALIGVLFMVALLVVALKILL